MRSAYDEKQKTNGSQRLSCSFCEGKLESLRLGEKELCQKAQSLFRLIASDEEGGLCEIGAEQFEKINQQPTEKGQKLVYEAYRAAGELRVIAEAEQRDDGIYWGISVENDTDLMIEKLFYPCIRTENNLEGEGGDYRLFLPCFEGTEIRKLQDIPGDEKEYPGFINMQYMAYYNRCGGLYLCAEDVTGTPKVIDCVKQGGGIDLLMGAFVAIAPKERYSLPYRIVTKAFDGGWQACAELYRDFVERSAFPLPPKLSERDDVPQFIRDYALVTIYPVRSVVGVKSYFGPNEYMPYCNALKYLDDFELETESKLMSLLIGWEGSATWAPPLMWPPYGGADALCEFIREMHKRGHYVGLYGSGLNWTDKSILDTTCDFTSYRKEHGVDQFLCKKRDQSLDPDNQFPMLRTGFHMCPHCGGTKELIYRQISDMLDSDVDYLQYFDQNLGGRPAKCYAKDHGHPASYNVCASEDMVEIAEAICQMAAKKGKSCILGCECAPADYLLRQFRFNDNRFHWAMQLSDFCGLEDAVCVPAFQFVFAEYIKNFMGNQCGFTKAVPASNRESLLMRLAYAFAAGDLLTVTWKGGGEIHYDWGADWIEPGPPQVVLKRLIRNLCRFHRGEAYSYLTYGRMEKNIPFSGEGRYVMIAADGREICYPEVFSSVWSYQGKTIQIFVNHTSENKTIVSEGTFARYLDEEASGAFHEITIPPYSAVGAVLVKA